MMRARVEVIGCVLALGWAVALSGCGDDEEEVQAAASGVEAGEWLPGGATTNTLLFGRNAFISPAENILPEHEPLFYSGNSYFNQPWVEAPASTTTRDGLGPLFNARSCAACHLHDGRGQPPEEGEEVLSLLLRLSVPGATQQGEGPHPEPRYGGQLQPYGIPGVTGEGRPVVDHEVISGTYDDGMTYALRRPTWRVEELAYGPMDAAVMISPRVAPQMIGLGLLEAIPRERLEALADPDDADGDGISGRLAALPGGQIGRFGWKGEQPTVREQSAGALLGDIGLTTTLHPAQECSPGQTACAEALEGGAPEVDDEILERIALYSALLAVPARAAWDDPEVLLGKARFKAAGCDGCHVARHQTGDHALAELRDQSIWPYTDLLLHDMGEGLSDGRPVFSASGTEWRTPPLWGIGRFKAVNGHTRLLHDGRADGVEEAILWHGGEAEASVQAFKALPAQERVALVRFVESL